MKWKVLNEKEAEKRGIRAFSGDGTSIKDYLQWDLSFKPNGINCETYLEQLIKDKIIERIEQ